MNKGIEMPDGSIVDSSTGETFDKGTEVQLLLNFDGENPNKNNSGSYEVHGSNGVFSDENQNALNKLYEPSGDDGERVWPDDY